MIATTQGWDTTMASNSSNLLDLKASQTTATEAKDEKQRQFQSEFETDNINKTYQQLTIPTFIQLFIMSRLIKKYFASQSKNRRGGDERKELETLAKLLKNEKDISQAHITLTKLLKNDIRTVKLSKNCENLCEFSS